MSGLFFTYFFIIACVVSSTSQPSAGGGLAKLFAAQSYGQAPTVTIKKGESPQFYIHYLALRGLADLPVLLLEASGVDYEATYYGKDDFNDNIKHTLPFGRLPVLTTATNKDSMLAQSDSIIRHIAITTGLAGDTLKEQATLDMWYETYKELFKQHARWGKPFSLEALLEGETPDVSQIISFRESSNGGEYSEFEKSYFALKTFEDSMILTKQHDQKNVFVGGRKKMSYVDIALFTVLETVNSKRTTWGKDLNFPLLQNLHDVIAASLQGYLQSERRMPKVEVRTVPSRDYWYVDERPTSNKNKNEEKGEL